MAIPSPIPRDIIMFSLLECFPLSISCYYFLCHVIPAHVPVEWSHGGPHAASLPGEMKKSGCATRHRLGIATVGPDRSPHPSTNRLSGSDDGYDLGWPVRNLRHVRDLTRVDDGEKYKTKQKKKEKICHRDPTSRSHPLLLSARYKIRSNYSYPKDVTRTYSRPQARDEHRHHRCQDKRVCFWVSEFVGERLSCLLAQIGAQIRSYYT